MSDLLNTAAHSGERPFVSKKPPTVEDASTLLEPVTVNGVVMSLRQDREYPDMFYISPDELLWVEVEAINGGYRCLNTGTAYYTNPLQLDTPIEYLREHPIPMPWGDPQPLIKPIAATPYPLFALPKNMCELVREINEYNGAPISLIATCALSTLSIAIQGHFNVARDERLISPVSLYTMVVADPNERKSSVDSLLTSSIKAWERKATEGIKEAQAQFKINSDEYDAKLSGLKSELLGAIAKGGSTDSIKAKMVALQLNAPVEPIAPCMFYSDTSREALTFGLSKYPTGGILSAEAGYIFGSHLMKKENAMGAVSFFNQLWSGEAEDLKVNRRGSESYSLGNVRFTFALQVQESVLRDFIHSSNLTRGSGFLARFLLTYPESTQGNRPYKPAPKHWGNRDVFLQRMTAILELPLRRNESGGLDPIVLEFDAPAMVFWIDCYNGIEAELAPNGKYHAINDVAGKAADNIARIAALFEVFKTDNPTSISVDSVINAAHIVGWHLDETKRFFNGIGADSANRDDIRLDQWLISQCAIEGTDSITKSTALTRSPLRRKDHLDDALSALVDLGRVRLVKTGKAVNIQLNPALLPPK